jgi:hypothetical protein
LRSLNRKRAAARRQQGKELASPFGETIDTVPVLRVILKDRLESGR